MKPRSLLLLFLLFCGLSLSFSENAAAQDIVVVVEDPQLHPAYTTCPQTFWYPFANNRGHTAYLTLNADAQYSTNYGEWHPAIPQSGYYRVEAYIAAHGPITWCSGQNPPTIQHDTTDAHYTVHHVYGATNRSLSQYPLSNQWLNLGEYYFNVGSEGYVHLTDLNGETRFTTTVSFSAMRFTYTRANRPTVYMPMAYSTDPVDPQPPNRGIIQAQGFDACSLPAISTMQTWWNSSPYKFYALYMGGIQLPAMCTVASAAWVSAVHQQGWGFIPTWVGPQAPCSGYSHKMSADPAIAYQEGRQEAKAASIAATTLGLTNNGWGGTVIYYDMEVFGGANLECRQAAAAFMNGWVERLHELGNIAGGYGAHNSYVEDWAGLPHVPNDVWAASWYTNQYDPAASVNGISWLDGLWTTHQRIRQYAGDHNESWGSKTLNIDSDVADGMIAMPPGNPAAIPIGPVSPAIQDTGWLTADQGWLVMENRLYWTADQGSSWQVLSPTNVQKAVFLPSGDAWVLSSLKDKDLGLYHSVDQGIRWEQIPFQSQVDSWRPLQMQFTSPDSGWIVLQKQASQAFNAAILLKTSDGGQTWQKIDLPFAGPVHFTSATRGWVENHTGEIFYQTADGGLTWQPAEPNMFLGAQSSLPEGTILSGWQESGLAWAISSAGACRGEKNAPDFSCTVDHTLLQSLDGGHRWQVIPLPQVDFSQP